MRWLLVIIVVVLTGEGIARFVFDAASRPLSVPHPEAEYIFAPNQRIERFGHLILYNALGMRSPQMAEVTQPRRVLVVGDSVLNGQSVTGHAELATTLATTSEIFFGHVSAGSWGPANILGWIEAFGLQEADTVIWVVSSHDLTDLPVFGPLDPVTHPTSPPLSALFDLGSRFVRGWLGAPEADNGASEAETTRQGIAAIEALISHLETAGVALCAIHHQTAHEIGSGLQQNGQVIQDILGRQGIPVLDFSTPMRAALAEGRQVFRDNIHITAEGQALLADEIRACARLTAQQGG